MWDGKKREVSRKRAKQQKTSVVLLVWRRTGSGRRRVCITCNGLAAIDNPAKSYSNICTNKLIIRHNQNKCFCVLCFVFLCSSQPRILYLFWGHRLGPVAEPSGRRDCLFSGRPAQHFLSTPRSSATANKQYLQSSPCARFTWLRCNRLAFRAANRMYKMSRQPLASDNERKEARICQTTIFYRTRKTTNNVWTVCTNTAWRWGTREYLRVAAFV